jgi:hypothetical protein
MSPPFDLVQSLHLLHYRIPHLKVTKHLNQADGGPNVRGQVLVQRRRPVLNLPTRNPRIENWHYYQPGTSSTPWVRRGLLDRNARESTNAANLTFQLLSLSNAMLLKFRPSYPSNDADLTLSHPKVLEMLIRLPTFTTVLCMFWFS